jgi:predicted DNA-binding antitoxin AbrB/MazE fold protein
MLKVIEAVYEKGIIKPLEQVNMKKGKKLKIKIENMLLFDSVKKYRKYFEDIEKALKIIVDRLKHS